jgi:antitoxin (DNA-binding transcriptional repressor) of toxin-antitoxin stability system
MRYVGLKVLKNKLSEYVRIAAAGETVLVTDRDRVVAEIVPPQPGRGLSDDEFLSKGAREGWFSPARITGAGPPLTGKPVMTFEKLMRDIEADREDQ